MQEFWSILWSETWHFKTLRSPQKTLTVIECLHQSKIPESKILEFRWNSRTGHRLPDPARPKTVPFITTVIPLRRRNTVIQERFPTLEWAAIISKLPGKPLLPVTLLAAVILSQHWTPESSLKMTLTSTRLKTHQPYKNESSWVITKTKSFWKVSFKDSLTVKWWLGDSRVKALASNLTPTSSRVVNPWKWKCDAIKRPICFAALAYQTHLKESCDSSNNCSQSADSIVGCKSPNFTAVN